MQHDSSELSPGRKDFWDDFYDADGGRLVVKEESNRRADELQTRGSLLDHYEWFMEFPLYEAQLVEAIQKHLVLPTLDTSESPSTLRVLHIGCGNSDFCDHVSDVFTSAVSDPRWTRQPPEVLNVDVCDNILAHLSKLYPARLYAVGSCCALTGSDSSATVSSSWYDTLASPTSEGCPQLLAVRHQSVDLVFDKGTVDALLSAFAGEYNENVAAYAEESLAVLRPGGLLFLISINSADTLDSYFLAASVANRSFHCCYDVTIHLAKRGATNLRVETLGSRYNCRAYVVVTD